MKQNVVAMIDDWIGEEVDAPEVSEFYFDMDEEAEYDRLLMKEYQWDRFLMREYGLSAEEMDQSARSLNAPLNINERRYAVLYQYART